MAFLQTFLDNNLFNSISSTIIDYLNDGVTFFSNQDILIQAGIIVGGGIIVFLGAIDLVKRLSKLIIIAVVLFGLWFVYTNYMA
jgi:hypothetical protein